MRSSSAPLRIFLLGEVRLESGGKPISLPQRESLLRLWVRLLLQAGQSQSRKALAFSLWPDDDEAQALANLRRHLYLIRNSLPLAGRELLVISPQTISWTDSPDCWLDVTAFERESRVQGGLEQAAELYRGDLASGLDSDEFILVRREELRNQYITLLKTLGQKLLEQGQYERALKWSRRLTAQDPWDEESVRLEMTIEAQAGNRAAAIATYQTLAQELENELQTQPMPETMALYSNILNNRLLRPSPAKKTSPPPVFVSREHELAELADSLEGLSHKHGKIVFISGEAGVGKTALLQEALRRFVDPMNGNTLRLFWGHCQASAEEAPERPYTPWRQVFSAAAPLLARSAEIPPEWLNRILPLVPDLSLLRPGLMAPSQPDAAELRVALRQGLHFLSMSQPLVLVIEDAHWMDSASVELLAELAETCLSLPLLILVTYRVGELPTSLLDVKRALRRQRCVLEMHLPSFTIAETRVFLGNALGQEAVNADVLDEIKRYSQGLPLLLREAVESLLKARRTQTPGRGLPSLRDSLKFRLEKMDGHTRQMLEAAAVLGFSLADNELKTLLNWSVPLYASTLDALQAQRLLLDSATPGSDDFIFPHQLIHEIILGEVPVERATGLHEQAARSLENVHTGQAGFAAEIAAHYQAAALPVPAARFWLKHAQENTDLAAFDQALEAIERANSLLGEDGSDSRELLAQAAVQRGVIALYRGQAEMAMPHLDAAVILCREFPALYAHALIMQAYALYTRDRSAEAYQAASQAYGLAVTLQDTASAVRALNIRGISALMLGRTRPAIDDLRQALSLLEQNAIETSAQTVQSLNHLGTALVFVQDYAQAGEILTKTVDMAQRGGLKRLGAAALTMLGQIALNRGRYPESIRIYSQSIEVAGASYLPGMWGKYAGRGWAHLCSGEINAASQDFEQGYRVAVQVNSLYGQLLMQTYQAATGLAQRQAAPVSLAQIEKQAAGAQLQPVLYLASSLSGQIWRALGAVEKAISAHERCLQAARSSDVPMFIQNAQVQLLFDRLLRAPDPDAFSQADDAIQKACAAGEIPLQALAWLAKGRGLFRATRYADALPCAEEALALARACPDQPLVGEALLLLGRIRAEMGQEIAAKGLLAEARVIGEKSQTLLLLAFGGEQAGSLREIALACLGESG